MKGKRLGYACLASILMLGTAVVPGGWGNNAYAEEACDVVSGAVEINGSTLCVMDSTVNQIFFTGTVEELHAMLFAFQNNAGYGWNSGTAIHANLTNVGGISLGNLNAISSATPTGATVEIIPAAGHLIYDNMSLTVPAGYSVVYDNVVVHLPEGTSESVALGVFEEINNQTAIVAINGEGNATVSYDGIRDINVVHLNTATTVADAYSLANTIKADHADSTFAVAHELNYWIKVTPAATQVNVLSAAALGEALDENSGIDTIYVNKSMTAETLNIPAGKTVIDEDGLLTVSNLADSSIEGTLTMVDGNYQIVKIGDFAEGTIALKVGDETLTAPALVKSGTRITATVTLDAAHADQLGCATLDGEVMLSCTNFTVRDSDMVISAVAYDVRVVPDAEDEIADATEATATANFVAEQVKDILRNNSGVYNGNIWLYFVGTLPAYFASGGALTTQLATYLVEAEDYETGVTGYEEMLAELGENENLVAIYNAYLVVNSIYEYEGESIKIEDGVVFRLGEPVTMRLEIPEEYREAPLGYTRNFTILAGHWDFDNEDEMATVTRITPTREGNYLLFPNSEFSSFAIVYEDVLDPIVTPETGVFTNFESTASGVNAGGLTLAAVLGAGVVLAFGAVKFAKRK